MPSHTQERYGSLPTAGGLPLITSSPTDQRRYGRPTTQRPLHFHCERQFIHLQSQQVTERGTPIYSGTVCPLKRIYSPPPSSVPLLWYPWLHRLVVQHYLVPAGCQGAATCPPVLLQATIPTLSQLHQNFRLTTLTGAQSGRTCMPTSLLSPSNLPTSPSLSFRVVSMY